VRQAYLAAALAVLSSAESSKRLDDLETALCALDPRDASFSSRGGLPTIW
jgi:hypothetical protein